MASASEGRGPRTLIDALLEEQRNLTVVEVFAQWRLPARKDEEPSWRRLIPLTAPGAGEQYAFEVDLDRCSGCKSCVTACHALNGLDDGETWRGVGLLHGRSGSFRQTITTACHHCVDPACLNGCPVLAYEKQPATGIVRHLDDQCIGCQYCVMMCPYEVPKYSERRGIVRKCDMCHQRLANSEAPACVQACPGEAIRITVVRQEEIRNNFRPVAPDNDLAFAENPFLQACPDPAITLPTTRYFSARPLPSNLLAGDAHALLLQPAHAPLVWMLVLTQLGAGAFAILPFISRDTQITLALMGAAATWLGLGASVLHLGRPQKAWRSFLGWRKSWLSREVIAFGVFGLFAVVSLWNHCSSLLVLSAAALVGLIGVFCSGMTYHATRRECWRGLLSIGRFFGTTLQLGLAAAWLAASLAEMRIPIVLIFLPLATVPALAREFAFLRNCPDDADLEPEPPASVLARTAFLMRHRFGLRLRLHIASAWLGGVVLPLAAAIGGSVNLWLSVTAFALCVISQIVDRSLFFRAASVPKMPGDIAA